MMNKKEFKDVTEFIRHRFSGIGEGDTLQGCCQQRCWRVVEGGSAPSECHLSVTRQGQTLLFNCFGAKCGIRGSIGVDGSSVSSVTRRSSPISSKSDRDIRLPDNFVRRLPSDARRWLSENGVSEDSILKHDIGYDESRGRIIFPSKENGKYNGYLSRSFNGTSKLKWYNNVSLNGCYTVSGNEIGVIVEAAHSAIYLNDITGVSTLALLTSRISKDNHKKIAAVQEWVQLNNIKELYLFLDPDVSYDKLRELKNILTKRIMDCKLIRSEKKPRKYKGEELPWMK